MCYCLVFTTDMKIKRQTKISQFYVWVPTSYFLRRHWRILYRLVYGLLLCNIIQTHSWSNDITLQIGGSKNRLACDTSVISVSNFYISVRIYRTGATQIIFFLCIRVNGMTVIRQWFFFVSVCFLLMRSVSWWKWARKKGGLW